MTTTASQPTAVAAAASDDAPPAGRRPARAATADNTTSVAEVTCAARDGAAASAPARTSTADTNSTCPCRTAPRTSGDDRTRRHNTGVDTTTVHAAKKPQWVAQLAHGVCWVTGCTPAS